MKLNLNENIPEFKIHPPDGEVKSFRDVYENNDHTLLLFLRYFGCTVCQLDLMEFRSEYEKYQQINTEVVIVLQSDPDIISKSGETMPYIVSCDPQQELYSRFDVVPAKSKLKMLSFNTIKKVVDATKKGMKHGEYEGNELQLPAAFVVDREGVIKFRKYASNLADIPTAENFLTIIGDMKDSDS